MTELGEQPEFMAQAVCSQTDPELFYPEKGQSPNDAKKTCRSCPVQVECLSWALEHHEWYGVWGGLSVRERRRLTKKKPAA